MTEYDGLDEIGEKLVDYAVEHAEFTKREGVIDRLFPYVFKASRRMSTRAISSWLQAEYKIKLSATTIAKALRESDRYWQAIYDDSEPDGRRVAAAYDVNVSDLLRDEDLFEVLRRNPPKAFSGDEAEEIKYAGDALAAKWFRRLDVDARNECLAAVRSAESQEEEAEGQDDEPGAK